MSRMVALRCSSLLLLALVVACGQGRRPNVILISADTLRADRLNAYGYTARTTSPHLDALARDGVLFEVAIAAAPWTVPSHMSLFTSLSPSAHGLVAPLRDLRSQQRRQAVRRLPAERTTLAEALAAHGWATAAFTGGATLDPRIGFDQGFARYETTMFKMSEANLAPMLAWIRAHRDEPFFLFWHTFEVHFPYHDATFIDGTLPPAAVPRLRTVLAEVNRVFAEHGHDDTTLDETTRALGALGALARAPSAALYDGGVHSMDAWLGRLMAFLRAEGLYDDTLIAFTSDHGEELGDHDPALVYNSHGHSLFEELIRVPLVIKLPGGAHAGTRVTTVARHIDVFPTLLDVLGLPADPAHEGVSLRPRWEAGADAPAAPALAEALAFAYEAKAVRTERWKYLVAIDAETVATHGRQYVPDPAPARELFDLATDPHERRNLLGPNGPPEARRIAADLDTTLRRLVAPALGPTERAELDDATTERLRALGYVE